MKRFFITGIDTGIGKTMVTGLIAKYLLSTKKSVVTIKPVQTGASLPEDIIMHRKIMNINSLPEDLQNITCPYIFKFPGSPHLSSGLEAVEIDYQKISRQIKEVSGRYEFTLIEGAGGLVVPLTKNYTMDLMVASLDCELIVVNSSRLGSINHTLLTIAYAQNKNIPISGIVYNYIPNCDQQIYLSTLDYLNDYYQNKIPIICVPEVKNDDFPLIDFSKILFSN